MKAQYKLPKMPVAQHGYRTVVIPAATKTVSINKQLLCGRLVSEVLFKLSE